MLGSPMEKASDLENLWKSRYYVCVLSPGPTRYIFLLQWHDIACLCWQRGGGLGEEAAKSWKWDVAVLEFYRKTVWFEATSRNSFLYRESEWCSNDVGVLSVLDTFIAVNAVERTNICSVLLVGMLPKCCAFQYKLHLKSGWKCTVWVRDSDGFLFGPWKTPGNSGKTLETSVRALDYVLIHGISFMN